MNTNGELLSAETERTIAVGFSDPANPLAQSMILSEMLARPGKTFIAAPPNSGETLVVSDEQSAYWASKGPEIIQQMFERHRERRTGQDS